MNSSPTEALVMVQYMMAVMLGGMSSATEPLEAIRPREKPLG